MEKDLRAREKSQKLALTNGISFSRAQFVIVASAFVLFGLIAILVSRAATTVNIAVDTNTVVGTSKMQTGVTHTQYDIYPHTNGTSPAALAAQDILKSTTNWQNQHIYGWGAGNPQPYPPTATTDNINWRDLDGRIAMMRKSGNPMIITLCCSPDWMKGGAPGETNWDNLSAAPLPEHVGDFANLSAKIAQRYPDVKYFQVWNEMKGMGTGNGLPGTPGCTPEACGQNRYDYERYTVLYNAVWDKIKAVRPDALIGGPYVVMDHWGTTSYSHPSFYPAKDRPGLPYYGDIDRRTLDVITYWLQKKRGADFITLDGKLGNRDGTKLVNDFDAAQSWIDIATWLRNLDPVQYPGKDLPLWWAEWYAQGNTKSDNYNERNAVMANSLIYTLKSGATLPLVWDSNGTANGSAFPLSLYTGVHPTVNGGAGPTDGGKPTPYTATSKGFKDYFQPGTELTKVTVSDPTQVAALASKTKILLVNKTAGDVIAVVNGVSRNLTPYQVLFTDISGTTATLSANITTPANGATVSGGIPVEAKPTSPNGISKVEFYLDNATTPYRIEASAPYCMAQDPNGPPCYNWDSNTVGNGPHSITAYVYDSAGVKSPASTVTFTVNNNSTSNGWELLYQDDFNTLNTSSASASSWGMYNGPGHARNGLRRPEAFSIVTDPADSTNKLLAITAENVVDPADGVTKVRSGGMANRTNITYGKYEVRVRTEADPTGTMSGLALTWPKSRTIGGITQEWWPGDGELDWYETGTAVSRNPFHTYLHWPCFEGACVGWDGVNGHRGTSDQTHINHAADATQWHVVTMEWTPTSIKMYRNGALVGQDNNASHIPDVPHHVSLQLDALSTRLLTQPVREYVDYVKVYKMSTTTGDTTAPAVNLTAPAAGATVSGTVPVSANATDNVGVTGVQFKLNGANLGAEDTSAPYSNSWNTSALSNGSYTLTAVARDAAGNSTTSSPVTVTVSNATDTTPPNVSISSPANNTTVSGTFTTTVTAFDPPSTTNGTGIDRVEYFLDATSGTPKIIERGVPYEYTINSLTLTNGPHTVAARAYDTAGNSTLATVTVNVQNVDTQPPNPPSSLTGVTTQPTASAPATVSLTWPAASDNGSPASGIKGYYVYRGGSVISPLITATSYIDSNVSAGVHAYSVRSVDNVDLTSVTASPSYDTTINAPSDTNAPTTPVNLNAVAVSSSQVDLSWSAATDAGGSGLKGYNIYRNGSATPSNATPVVTTSYGDTGVAPSSTYTYQVEAVDYAGNKSAKSAEVSVSTQSAPQVLTILPAADAYVTQKFPTRTYGTDNVLKADGSPDQDVLLTFNVSGIGTKTVKSARLRLHVSQSSNQGGNLYKLTNNTWNEASVTWATAPSADAISFSTIGRVYGGSYIDIDLSSYIKSDGIYGLKLSSSSTDNVSYNSKEAATNKPQLVLEIE